MTSIFDKGVTTDKTAINDAIIELSAEVSSINTAVEMRDNHL